MTGIIGGSGLYEIPGFRAVKERSITTPYGEPSDAYTIGELSGREVVFLPRHSGSHNIPPHEVNYLANIWGFRECCAERIIAVSAVGAINTELRPGDLIVPDQLIDFTRSRKSTFYNRGDVVHVDFTEPYCPELRSALLKAAETKRITAADGGTYICVEGPRLETAAEIKFFDTAGADIIGMTGMPEALLARELEICYAALSVVTNLAAGTSSAKLTTKEVLETMKESEERIKLILSEAVMTTPEERGCPCKDALNDTML